MSCKLSISKKKFVLVIYIFVSVFAYGQMAGIHSSDNRLNNIIIINSYTESSIWSNYFLNGIYEAIQKQNKQYLVFTEHLNMLMVESETNVQNIWSKLSEKYENSSPKVIIVLGNQSWALLGEEIRNKWSDAHVILCLEENFVSSREFYLKKKAIPDNLKIPFEKAAKDKLLTVMYVPYYVKETLSLMKQMMPDMDRLLFLSDARYISAQNKMDLDNIVAQEFPGIEVEHLVSGLNTTDTLIKVLEESDKNTGVLFFSWYQKSLQGANVFTLMNIYRVLNSFGKLPIFTLEDNGVANRGLLGGYFNTQAELEKTTEKVVREVLSGKSFDYVITPPGASPVINYQVLLDKGFSEKSVPANTYFYMKPPTFWEQYKYYVIGGFCVLLALYIYKSLNDRRRFKLLDSYRSLFNNMPVAYLKLKIIYDGSGNSIDSKILEINHSFKVLFNANEEIRGKKISELRSSESDQLYHLIRMVDDKKRKVTFQYQMKEADIHLNIIITSSGIKGIIEIFCVDNTELARLQQTLHNVNHKLAMSLEAADLVPWKWDLKKHTILCDVNKPVELGVTDEFSDEAQLSVSEETYFSKICKEDREHVHRAYKELLEGTRNKMKEEYRVFEPGHGHFNWVEVQAVVGERDAEGNPLVLIGSSQIVTNRKKLQEELVQAKLRAEESNRLKSAFLANMSHEIRTPLNAIVGFSSVLASTEEKEEKQEYLSIIENNNTLLLQLISDILDLSKIEAGTLEFVYSDVDLNALLREQEQAFSLRVKNDGVKLIFDECMANCFIYTERNRLLQVFGNLLTNAIKFTQKGDIRFGYRLKSDNFLYFYVRDTGCGIPSDKLNSVFGRFVKLDNFAQGTGLGLSICKTIVENMGGEIGVESHVGEGTKFWFTLPYKAGKDIVAESASEVLRQEVVEKDKLTVLIAEDNASNFKLFESVLKREYKIIHAWDGEEAVRLFKEHEPHIVLMDINMPLMDGYEATRRIREITSKVPIIAVTAYAFSSDEQRIKNSGFDAYTPKPINAESLKKQMINLLTKRLVFI